jgi:hypothetical protein
MYNQEPLQVGTKKLYEVEVTRFMSLREFVLAEDVEDARESMKEATKNMYASDFFPEGDQIDVTPYNREMTKDTVVLYEGQWRDYAQSLLLEEEKAAGIKVHPDQGKLL